MRYASIFTAAVVLSGCTDTGQPEVSFPAYFVPNPELSSFVVGDVTVDLSEARVAFGPAYFCASASGSATLCETALGEIRSDTVIDLLQTDQQSLGTYRGFVGNVQSASYDHGIHWYMSQQEPRVSSEALDGHSARFRGTATRAGVSKAFEMNVDLVPQYRGQRGVPTVAIEQGAVFESGKSISTKSIEVRLDVASWLSKVDYEQMLASSADPYVIEAGSTDHDSVVIRMVSNSPAGFVFVHESIAPAQ